MIRELLLASTLATIPAIDPSPFTDDLTISYETPNGTVLLSGYHITSDALKYPPHPGVASDQQGGALIYDDGLDDPSIILESTEFEQLPNCTQMQCSAPNLAAVPDWSTIYQMRYGLQIENFHVWSWPGTTTDYFTEALNNLKASFQTFHASALRDLGVDLKIQHVHFRTHDFTAADYNSNSGIEDRWKNDLGLARPVKYVLRLFKYPGGLANTLLHCPGEIRILISRAGYYFSVETPANDIYKSRNAVMHTVAQELFHMILALRHSQCYIDPSDDTSIELCNESGSAFCYQGQAECPPYDEISYMGYCGQCYRPENPISLPYPDLRIGSRFGPMAAIARSNLLFMAEDCPLPVVGTMFGPGTLDAYLDSDGDEYPNFLDNCVASANNDQVDSDLDGKGDPCDSCAIVPNGRGGWLLLPAALLMIVTRRTRVRGNTRIPLAQGFRHLKTMHNRRCD